MQRALFVPLLALFASAGLSPQKPRGGRGYYVAPDGTGAGDGSERRPWDLTTALRGAGGGGGRQTGKR